LVGETISDTCDVGRELWIRDEIAALHLPRRKVLRLADGDLVGRRQQRQFAPARDGIDGAASATEQR
jgi:hypothetical protein